MDDIQIPSPGNVAAAVDSTSKLAATIQRMFPGIAMGSVARAESKITKRTLDDMEAAKKWGEGAGLSPESIGSMCNDIYFRNTRGDRMRNVIAFAAESVDPNAELCEPSEDWTERFKDYAEKSGDEDMQRLWGAVLAGEMERPGSFSKRTMGILADMSKADAETFRDLCARCIGGPLGNGDWMGPIPMIVAPFERFFIPQERLNPLNALGLTDIRTEGGIFMEASFSFNTRGIAPLALNGKSYAIEKGEGDLVFMHCRFTAFGEELARLCSLGCADGFDDAVFSWIAESGARVFRIVEWGDDGTAKVAPH